MQLLWWFSLEESFSKIRNNHLGVFFYFYTWLESPRRWNTVSGGLQVRSEGHPVVVQIAPKAIQIGEKFPQCCCSQNRETEKGYCSSEALVEST